VHGWVTFLVSHSCRQRCARRNTTAAVLSVKLPYLIRPSYQLSAHTCTAGCWLGRSDYLHHFSVHIYLPVLAPDATATLPWFAKR
jgi:hypothetical protein